MADYRIVLKDRQTGEESAGYSTSPLNTQDLVDHIRKTHRQHEVLKVERADKPEPPFIAPAPVETEPAAEAEQPVEPAPVEAEQPQSEEHQ